MTVGIVDAMALRWDSAWHVCGWSRVSKRGEGVSRDEAGVPGSDHTRPYGNNQEGESVGQATMK